MTKGRMQHAVKHYREALRHHESKATQALNHAHAHTVQVINQRLSHLYREMDRAMADGEQIPASWLYESNRLQNTLRVVESQMDHYATMGEVTANQMQRIGVQLGQQGAQALLQSTVPAGIKYVFGVPDARAIANMVGMTADGSPLSVLFDRFGREASQNVKNALIQGITLGDNPRKVARDVAQALDVSRQRALVIAQNEMMRACRGANSESFKANADVLDGWVWQADLGGACLACTEQNGSVHPVDEDMASHVRCECVMLPLTKSWSDILGSDIDTSDLEDTSIDIPSGASWFDQQDEATQMSILGKSRFQLYQDGMSLSDMVGTKSDDTWGDSIYIKPLKELAKT